MIKHIMKNKIMANNNFSKKMKWISKIKILNRIVNQNQKFQIKASMLLMKKMKMKHNINFIIKNKLYQKITFRNLIKILCKICSNQILIKFNLKIKIKVINFKPLKNI